MAQETGEYLWSDDGVMGGPDSSTSRRTLWLLGCDDGDDDDDDDTIPVLYSCQKMHLFISLRKY